MKFVKSFPLLLIVVTSTAATGLGADTAEALISRYIDAIGGQAAIERIQTQVTKGTFTLPDMGISARFETYVQPPDRSYMFINFSEVAPASNGVNGDVAWQIHPMTGPQILAGEDRLAALRGAEIEPLLHWKKYYTKAEVAGEEPVGDQACTKVTFTPEKGSNLVIYFNNETHLMVRMIGIQGGMKTQTDISDYRDAGALKQAYLLKVMTSQFSFEFQIDSIEQNVPISAEKFALPAEIQTLVGK